MVNRSVILVSSAVVGGFFVGLAIGKGTRESIDSGVSADYKDGVFTVSANLKTALSDGIMSLFS